MCKPMTCNGIIARWPTQIRPTPHRRPADGRGAKRLLKRQFTKVKIACVRLNSHMFANVRISGNKRGTVLMPERAIAWPPKNRAPGQTHPNSCNMLKIKGRIWVLNAIGKVGTARGGSLLRPVRGRLGEATLPRNLDASALRRTRSGAPCQRTFGRIGCGKSGQKLAVGTAA